MIMKPGLILLATSSVLLGACSEPPAPAAEPVDPATRGAELLGPFKSDLMQALSSGMQEGPVAAIEVCSETAPGIAASLSVDGVRMGRSSHKLRNPDNAPPEWLEPLIADYVSGGSEMQPQTVALADGRTGYAEPIIVKPVCLTCHGTELDPGIAAQIAQSYPADEATGFSEGDFRGVFWVEF
jgi:hypothetical protein